MKIDFNFFKDCYEQDLLDNKTNFESSYAKLVTTYLSKTFGMDIDYTYEHKTKDFLIWIVSSDKKISFNEFNTVDEIEKWIKNNIGDSSKDDIKLKEIFYKFIQSEPSVGDKQGILYAYGQYVETINNIINLLCYAMNGDIQDVIKYQRTDMKYGFNKLWHNAQEYADKHRDEKDTAFMHQGPSPIGIARVGEFINFATVDPMFDGIKVKLFKNGKIEIKGLSSDEWDRIVKIVNLAN